MLICKEIHQDWVTMKKITAKKHWPAQKQPPPLLELKNIQERLKENLIEKEKKESFHEIIWCDPLQSVQTGL